MKRALGVVGATFLLAGSALAADLPTKAPPPMMVAVYNWTGFYIGGNLGGAWSSGNVTETFTDGVNSFALNYNRTNNSGFIGGGQIGYNWQVSPQFVLGLEWMFDGSSLSGGGTADLLGIDTLHANVKTDWITTLAARFGYAANNWLFYAKGGGGWVQNNVNVSNSLGVFSVSTSNTNSGWLVGAGIEYGLTPNWTMKAEWDYLGLRSFTLTGPLAPALVPVNISDTVNVSRNINMFTVGVNYKF